MHRSMTSTLPTSRLYIQFAEHGEELSWVRPGRGRIFVESGELTIKARRLGQGGVKPSNALSVQLRPLSFNTKDRTGPRRWMFAPLLIVFPGWVRFRNPSSRCKNALSSASHVEKL